MALTFLGLGSVLALASRFGLGVFLALASGRLSAATWPGPALFSAASTAANLCLRLLLFLAMADSPEGDPCSWRRPRHRANTTLTSGCRRTSTQFRTNSIFSV